MAAVQNVVARVAQRTTHVGTRAEDPTRQRGPTDESGELIFRDGTRPLYSIRPESFDSVPDFLEELWPSSLSNLKAAVERERRPKRRSRSA